MPASILGGAAAEGIGNAWANVIRGSNATNPPGFAGSEILVIAQGLTGHRHVAGGAEV